MVIAVHRQQAEGKHEVRRIECREHVVTESAEGLEFRLLRIGGEDVVRVAKSPGTQVFVMNDTGRTIKAYRWT